MANQRYLFIQRSDPTERPQEEPSAEQMEQMFAAFNAWKEKYAANIVDMGGPLRPSGKVVSMKGATDGPFAESKEIVGGYMLVEAENYERAVEIAQESPGVMMPGSSVEVREIGSMDEAG